MAYVIGIGRVALSIVVCLSSHCTGFSCLYVAVPLCWVLFFVFFSIVLCFVVCVHVQHLLNQIPVRFLTVPTKSPRGPSGP